MRPTASICAWLYGASLALGVASPAWAAGDALTIQGLGVEKTITCDDREVVIQGSNHRLTLRGPCPLVQVRGTNHVIRVERLGRATVTGVNNRLEWEHALRGDEPEIKITGLGSRAVRVRGQGTARPGGGEPDQASVAVEGTGGRVVLGPGGISVEGGAKRRREGQVTVGAEPAPAAALTVVENKLERAYDCAGGSAVLHGNENRLTLSRCPELTITGNDNQIELVGPVRHIRLPGNDNTVEWSEGDGGQPPKVEALGSGNRVRRQ
jgi:hypothetical protein